MRPGKTNPESLNLKFFRTLEYEGFVPPEIRGNVTISASHRALTLIAWGKLTFGSSCVLNRVDK